MTKKILFTLFAFVILAMNASCQLSALLWSDYRNAYISSEKDFDNLINGAGGSYSGYYIKKNITFDDDLTIRKTIYCSVELGKHILNCKRFEIISSDFSFFAKGELVGKIVVTEGDFFISNSSSLGLANVDVILNSGSKIVVRNLEGEVCSSGLGIKYPYTSIKYSNSDEIVPIVLLDNINFKFGLTGEYGFSENDYKIVIEGDNVIFDFEYSVIACKDITVDVYGKNTKIVKNDKLIVNNFSSEEIEWIDSAMSANGGENV